MSYLSPSFPSALHLPRGLLGIDIPYLIFILSCRSWHFNPISRGVENISPTKREFEKGRKDQRKGKK